MRLTHTILSLVALAFAVAFSAPAYAVTKPPVLPPPVTTPLPVVQPVSVNQLPIFKNLPKPVPFNQLPVIKNYCAAHPTTGSPPC